MALCADSPYATIDAVLPASAMSPAELAIREREAAHAKQS